MYRIDSLIGDFVVRFYKGARVHNREVLVGRDVLHNAICDQGLGRAFDVQKGDGACARIGLGVAIEWGKKDCVFLHVRIALTDEQCNGSDSRRHQRCFPVEILPSQY